MDDFEKIYHDTYENTLRYIFYHCDNIEDVNDLLQETYLSLHKALIKSQEIKDIDRYIIGIASKKIKDYYRSNYKLKGLKLPLFFKKNGQSYDLLEEISTDYNLENIVIDTLELKTNLLKINQKDKTNVKIFYLYFYYGLTLKEIAKELNMNESTVKSKLYQTVKEIKKKHKKEDEVNV